LNTDVFQSNKFMCFKGTTAEGPLCLIASFDYALLHNGGILAREGKQARHTSRVN